MATSTGVPAMCRSYTAGVPDQKPPRSEGDERDTLRILLQYQRDSIVRKVSGIGEAAAHQSPVSSGITPIWLMKHMARAESLWILRRFAGQPVDLPDDTVQPTDTLAAAVAVYRTTWTDVDAVVAAASLDQSCRDVGDEAPVNLRWVLMHLLEETARHAGHADILRELIDGDVGR
jgi:uncharacterized damage-inducible protein DinB